MVFSTSPEDTLTSNMGRFRPTGFWPKSSETHIIEIQGPVSSDGESSFTFSPPVVAHRNQSKASLQL